MALRHQEQLLLPWTWTQHVHLPTHLDLVALVACMTRWQATP